MSILNEPRPPDGPLPPRRRRSGQYPTTLSVPVTDEMRERLEGAAMRFGDSVAAILRGCIEHGLEAELKARRDRGELEADLENALWAAE